MLIHVRVAVINFNELRIINIILDSSLHSALISPVLYIARTFFLFKIVRFCQISRILNPSKHSESTTTFTVIAVCMPISCLFFVRFLQQHLCSKAFLFSTFFSILFWGHSGHVVKVLPPQKVGIGQGKLICPLPCKQWPVIDHIALKPPFPAWDNLIHRHFRILSLSLFIL